MVNLLAFFPIAAAAPADPVPVWAHILASIVIYILLLFIGRTLRVRTGVPLGLVYQVFAMGVAMYLPTLYPHHDPIPLERAGVSIILIAGALVLSSFLRRYLWEKFFLQKRNTKVPKFLSEFFSLLLVVIAVGIVLRVVYDKDTSSLLTASGVLGIILGLAFQDLLGNIISGFAIYFGGQFKVGDWLLVEGTHGEIMEINWRSTRLRTNDNICLDVPNSKITKEMVINFNFPTSLHAMRFEIGLDYNAPPTLVKKVLTEATLMAPDVLQNPAPVIYLKDFASSSITYQVKFWIDDHARQNQIYSDIRTNTWYALRRNDISIPYPIQVEHSLPMPHPKTASRDEIREAIKKVSFAQCFSEQHLQHLIQAARNVQFGKGEHITEQGQGGDSMLILMEGSAEVFISAHGARSSVAKLNAGDCIGEMSLLTGERRSATVIALTDCDAVEIDKKDIAPIIEEAPTLLDNLSNLLAARKLQLDGVLADTGGRVEEEKRKEYRAGFLRSLKSFFDV